MLALSVNHWDIQLLGSAHCIPMELVSRWWQPMPPVYQTRCRIRCTWTPLPEHHFHCLKRTLPLESCFTGMEGLEFSDPKAGGLEISRLSMQLCTSGKTRYTQMTNILGAVYHERWVNSIVVGLAWQTGNSRQKHSFSVKIWEAIRGIFSLSCMKP